MTIAVDGGARGDGRLVRRGGRDRQSLGDPGPVQQAIVPLLAVQVVVLLVDEVLVLQELPVEEADPLFYDAGRGVIGHGAFLYGVGIDVPSSVFVPRVSSGACVCSCRACDTTRIVGTATCRA